jgi:hypothetical protein
MKKTLVGCLALLGEDARPSDHPVDVVVEGRHIHDIRPSGAVAPQGAVIDLTGRLSLFLCKLNRSAASGRKTP